MESIKRLETVSTGQDTQPTSTDHDVRAGRKLALPRDIRLRPGVMWVAALCRDNSWTRPLFWSAA